MQQTICQLGQNFCNYFAQLNGKNNGAGSGVFQGKKNAKETETKSKARCHLLIYFSLTIGRARANK